MFDSGTVLDAIRGVGTAILSRRADSVWLELLLGHLDREGALPVVAGIQDFAVFLRDVRNKDDLVPRAWNNALR